MRGPQEQPDSSHKHLAPISRFVLAAFKQIPLTREVDSAEKKFSIFKQLPMAESSKVWQHAWLFQARLCSVLAPSQVLRPTRSTNFQRGMLSDAHSLEFSTLQLGEYEIVRHGQTTHPRILDVGRVA